MREILFRGKTDKGKWVQGVPFFEEERCYIIEDLFICDEYDCTGAVNTMVIPETIGQYTGLTDKNGTKIFEGDILAFKDYKENKQIEGVVRYGTFNCSCCEGVYGWYIDGGDIRYVTDKFLYVIGNIHDNPELLKGGEGK